MSQTFFIYVRFKKNSDGMPVVKKQTRELIEYIDTNITTINKHNIMIDFFSIEKSDTAELEKLQSRGIKTLPVLINGQDQIEDVQAIKKYIQDAVAGNPKNTVAKLEHQAHELEEEEATHEYFESVLDEDDDVADKGSQLAMRAAMETKRRGIGTQKSGKPMSFEEMRKKRRAEKAARNMKQANKQKQEQSDDEELQEKPKPLPQRRPPTKANVRNDPVSILKNMKDRDQDDDLSAKFWEGRTAT